MVQQPPPPPPPPPPFFFAANAMPISWFQSSGLVKFHVAHQSCFSSESPHGVSAPILPKSPMSFSEGALPHDATLKPEQRGVASHASSSCATLAGRIRRRLPAG